MALVKDDSDSTNEIDTETCKYCHGDSAMLRIDCIQTRGNFKYKTSKEWCAEFGTCAATIDWDHVYRKIE